jgi:hypothetical protein
VSAGFKMPLAIIGLVCPEARVKFKNIDFRTEADFACYCIAWFLLLLDSAIISIRQLSTAELAWEYWQPLPPPKGGKRPENPPLLGAFCRPKDTHSQGLPLRLGGNLIDPCVVNLQVLWCFWHRDPYSTNGSPCVHHVTLPPEVQRLICG